MRTDNKYYIDTFHSSLFKHGEELCGDMVKVIHRDDKTVLVLADGMGSGVKANILATLTSRIISTMLSGGASIDDCVATITSTLPVCKERGMAYSTFTIVEVSHDGEVYTAEFDGPEMLILRDGVIDESIEKEMRVLSGRNVWESHFQAAPDDMFVTFSDGVIHAGIGHLVNLGWKRVNVMEFVQRNYHPGISAREMTMGLIGICNDLYQGEAGDDTTVAVARIIPRTVTRIMVGPPADPKDDAHAVEVLLQANGRKIVCGGTTSQVVARQLKQPLRAENRYYTDDVPPIAHIEGIDLVTEGVLTLTATEKIVDAYLEEVDGDRMPEEFVDLKKRDGATRLASILLEECSEIVFMLGQANNPAYNKLDPSLGLDAKMRIVHSITGKLRRLGKTVNVEEF